MKRVSFKVANALKEAGYWKEQLHGDYPIWKIEDTVIRFDTPWGLIGYGLPTYMQVWLWLWREKKDCNRCKLSMGIQHMVGWRYLWWRV